MKVTTTWKQDNLGLSCPGHYSYSTLAQMELMEKEVVHSSPRVDTMEVKEFCLDNVWGPVCTTEGHYSPIWYSQCTWQYQCQGTLYVGPCACRLNARPSVAYHSGVYWDPWGVTSRVLLGAHLSMQLEHLLCQNPHKNGGCLGPTCQLSTTGSPPNSEARGVHQQPLRRVDLGVHRLPRPGGMAQTRARTGQGAAA